MKKFAIAALMMGAAGLAQAAMTGEQVYQKHCKMCHEAGLAGAPKKGDKAAWAPRVKQGDKVLFDHAKNGFKAMPPKGTCTTCTDDELKAAIKYTSN